MTLALIALLATPVCATLASLFIGLGFRNETLDDGALLRHFVFVLVSLLVLLLGVTRLEAVRLHIDPQYKLLNDLEAHSVYDTFKRTASSDYRELTEFLAAELLKGQTLDAAFLQARNLLTRLGNQRMGFADQKTRILWARSSIDTLKVLQARDPTLCYRAIAQQPLNREILATAFSPQNTQPFQQAVVALYESAARGMRHEYPADEKPADFNETALEYRAIQDAISQEFGSPISTALSTKQFPDTPAEAPEQLCEARIFQLEAMLERPQAQAALLVDSVLR